MEDKNYSLEAFQKGANVTIVKRELNETMEFFISNCAAEIKAEDLMSAVLKACRKFQMLNAEVAE